MTALPRPVQFGARTSIHLDPKYGLSTQERAELANNIVRTAQRYNSATSTTDTFCNPFKCETAQELQEAQTQVITWNQPEAPIAIALQQLIDARLKQLFSAAGSYLKQNVYDKEYAEEFVQVLKDAPAELKAPLLTLYDALENLGGTPRLDTLLD